jgi:hypothetical protein
MYSFSELCPDPPTWQTSFAYWLCRLNKLPPPDVFSAENLKSAMGYHFEVEEQAHTLNMLNSPTDLIPKYLAPLAPVTLAQKWSPFPLAISMLGDPEFHGASERSRSAFAVWSPRYLGKEKITTTIRDEEHFVFLFRLAASAALEAKCRILLVGSPGWSYESAVDNRMNPDTALLMLQAGYVFTERVSR